MGGGGSKKARKATQSKSKEGDSKPIVAKIAILGDSNVGKTALLIRYAEDRFEENTPSTIENDYKVKELDYQGTHMKLQIWDTGGQERFGSATSSFYRGSLGLIFVVDISEENGLKKVQKWIDDAKRNVSIENVSFVLVGSKKDLEAERKVSVEEATKLAQSFSGKYFETSSKTGVGIGDAFSHIAAEIKRIHDGRATQKN